MLKTFHNGYRKYNNLKKRIVSYVVIIILAILTNMIGYTYTIENLKNVMLDNNQKNMSVLQGVCDIFFGEIESTAYGLNKSENVSRIAINKEGDYNIIDLTKSVIREMDNMTTKESVDAWSIILPERGMCISNRLGLTDLDLAYETLYSKYFESKEEWLAGAYGVSGADVFVKNSHHKMADDENGITSGNNEDKQMYFVYRVPNARYKLAIMATINQEKISEMLGSSDNENITLLVSDSGNVLHCSDPDIKISEYKETEDSYTIRNRRYIVSSVGSGKMPLRYVRMIPEYVYFGILKRTRAAFVLGYILCVCITGSLAILFSRYENKRETKILEEISEERKKMRANLLRQLLLNDVNIENTPAGWFGEELKGKYFMVLVFDFSMLNDDNSASSINTNLLCKYLSASLSKNIQDIEVMFCVIDDMCTGVLSFYHSSTDIQQIKKVVYDICVSSGKEFDIDLRCAMSAMVEDIGGLNYAYEQTQEIINMRFLGDEKIVFVYDDIMGMTGKYHLNAEVENNLIDNIVLLGNSEVACKIVSDCLESYKKEQITVNEMRIVLSEFINILLKLASQNGFYEKIDCKPLYMLISNMTGIHYLNEAKRVIMNYIEELCTMTRETEKEESSELTENVKKYIAQNYSIIDLNVNMIADYFKVNRSMLSKKFKADEGSNISEYIIRYRLNKAKELFYTKDTLNHIAEATGFTSRVVFYRAFKKYEGVGPSEYRNIISKKENMVYEDEEEEV